jgi:ribosomal protein S18 acetylase RimI-like enzyme
VTSDLRFSPISQTPWGDVARVFGTRGDPAGCWCQYFKVTNTEWNSLPREELEAMLRDQATGDTTGPGLIAYADGEPARWVAVEPRTRTPRIFNSRISMAGRREPDDDQTVWAITCLVVPVGHRRQGIGTALVTEAVALARSAGARVIEGYPVDTAAAGKVSSADLYHGTVAMFAQAGFDVVARPTQRRAVVRLEL